MGYYEAPGTWVRLVSFSELLDGFTGRTPMSDSTSCLLGWSDCSEKNLPIFHLEGESLVVSVLEAAWGKKWLRCFKIHYLHCPLSSIFNLVFPTSGVPNVPKLCHLLSWLCLNLNLLSSARADEKPSPAEADEGWFGRGLLTTFEQTLSQSSCLPST